MVSNTQRSLVNTFPSLTKEASLPATIKGFPDLGGLLYPWTDETCHQSEAAQTMSGDPPFQDGRNFNNMGPSESGWRKSI